MIRSATALLFLGAAIGAWAVTGNIAPNAIEIDGSPAAGATTEQQNQANLYATGAQTDQANFPPSGLTGFLNGPILNAPAAHDWVLDALTNTDTKTYVNGVVTGIDPAGTNTGGVPTGALNAKGHWSGVRIIDVGISGDPTHDDIFTKGGKENLPNDWPTKIAGGSIGSDKYNFTQGYLANNNSYLFAAFERAGTNGTTAFDLEFNKLAPDPTKQPGYNPNTNPNPTAYVPNRSAGDILFTFEAHGSGGSDSGTVTPHFFVYVAGTTNAFVEQTLPAGIFTSTNNNYTTKCEPWGHVNFTNTGIWDYTNLNRFELAEVAVPIQATFGNFTPCLATYYTSIRTRASATDTSDLKDAGPLFKYSFGGPQAAAAITPLCDLYFSYTAAGSKTSNNDAGNAQNMSYSWQFQKATGVADDPNTPNVNEAWANFGNAVSGFSGNFGPVAAGVYRALLTVTEAATCVDTTASNQATALTPVSGTPSVTVVCDLQLNYAVTGVTGGTGPYTYAWSFKSGNDANPFATSTSASGNVLAPDTDPVSVTLIISDSNNPACTTTYNLGPYTPRAPIATTPSLTPICDQDINYDAGTPTGGTAPYGYSWSFIQDGAQFATSNTTTGTVHAPNTHAVTAVLTVTDSSNPQCSKSFNVGPVNPNTVLDASAVKTSADGSALSVLLTGSATMNGAAAANPTFQWQRFNSTTSAWDNIAGETAATLTYSTFEADDKSGSSPISFTIGSDSYAGKLYEVQLRLYAYVTVNGDKCEDFSPAVTVKKVIAVDP